MLFSFSYSSFKYFEGSFGAFSALQLLMLARSSGFSTGVANMGGSCAAPTPIAVGRGGAPQNLMEEGLSQNMRGAWEELKILSKIPVKEFI